MRNVLMVAFHYPPIAGSAGALRSRAFAAYLPRYDWRPHVLAPHTAVYTDVDRDAPASEHESVKRTWALDARRDFGWKGRYPALAAVPDRWISWAPTAIAAGLKIIREQNIDVIWSTYPIATSHLIAATIARLTGLPWVAEFRDPVGLDSRPPIQRWAQQAIERRVLSRATHIVFVTPGALADCRQRFPETARRSSLIPNGFDEALEPEIGVLHDETVRPDGPFRLLHTGHLYRSGRNPYALFDALFSLKEQGRIDASKLQIVFRNSQEEAVYQGRIDQLGLGDIVTLARRLNHRESLAEQRSADGLLLLQGREFNRQIPAKLFEYLRAKRPVLALVDATGDTSALLDELGGALKVAVDDPAAIADALLGFIESRSPDTSDCRVRPVNEQALSGYSRGYQTQQLAQRLDDAIEEKKRSDRVPHIGN